MSNITEILRLQPQQLWLISVPNLGDLTTNLQKNNLSESVKISNFNVPKETLRVGTLDQLVALSDDLGRIEISAESNAKKLCSYLYQILSETEDDLVSGYRGNSSGDSENSVNSNMQKLLDSLMMNQGRSFLHDYIRSFRWDAAKFPIKGRNLKEVLGDLNEVLFKAETAFKKKSTDYNNLNRDLAQILKKQTGSLLTRDLTNVIEPKRHLVSGSEYLETLVVVVPKNLVDNWKKSYERLADYVVPRSSTEIISDNDYTLFTVVLFQRCIDEFKTNCQKSKFTIRDISKMFNLPDQNNNTNGSEKVIDTPDVLAKRLRKEKARHFPVLVKWLQVNYRECVSVMMHLKVMKCFTESVLRYGLPVQFESIVLQPPSRAIQKLNYVLDDTYKSMNHTSNNTYITDNSALEGVSVGITSELTADYKPYVFNVINCDFVHQAVGIQRDGY